jgi:hypothetical protein
LDLLQANEFRRYLHHSEWMVVFLQLTDGFWFDHGRMVFTKTLLQHLQIDLVNRLLTFISAAALFVAMTCSEIEMALVDS